MPATCWCSLSNPQLTETNLPNNDKGQFVDSVGQWVQLFSNGIVDGKLPEASSWLGVMSEAYNQKLMADVLEGFNVWYYYLKAILYRLLLCREPTFLRGLSEYITIPKSISNEEERKQR